MSGTMRGEHLRLVLSHRGQTDPLADVASAAASGDRGSVRALLLAVTPHLLRVVRKVLGAHHTEVDDVTQESAALPSHRGECSVLHFACRVAVLTAMNIRRRDATQKRLRTRDDAVPVEGYASDSPAPDAEVIAQARAKAVRDLLDTLPVAQAEVLAMHCVLGYTVREIADVSGTPVETVRSRLRLAKQALRTRVADDPELRKIVGDEA
jgi:RNA polymerase sigma-70 factor (ECF subfamily)